MKNIAVVLGLVAVGGFMFGLTYDLTSDVKSMLVGQLIVIAGMCAMGVIFFLCWAVYTRNMGSRQQSRNPNELGYPQLPMFFMTGQPQPPQQIGQSYGQRPMLDLKAENSKNKEYVEW